MSTIRPTISADITLAILAGGESSRMGMPKANLTVASQPILQHLLDRIAWPGPTMLVTAPGREYPAACERFTSEVSDPERRGGPLRGVLTALEHLTTPMLLVLTVDMPAIGRPQCDFLLDQLREKRNLLGVMMRRMIHGSPQFEPFPCLIRAAASTVIEQRLAGNRRSIHGLLEEPGFVSVDAPKEWEERVWTNLNTKADLEVFVQCPPERYSDDST